MDASIIAQYVASLVVSLPHEEDMDDADLLISSMIFQPGEVLEVPILITNEEDLLSFEVDSILRSEFTQIREY